MRVDVALGDAESQCQGLREFLSKNGPRGVTPLTERLGLIRARIAREGRELARKGQKVVLVIATDGMPTGSHSTRSGAPERNRLVNELRRISLELPVHLVVRLCTDEDDVVEFYNGIDGELELQIEVLDDMKSEAVETRKAGNGWLTYSPLIHRIREGGTFLKVFDLLDERRLDPGEVSLVAQLLLRRAGEPPFPCDPEAFLDVVRERLPDALPVYDPATRRMGPPLKLRDVERAVRRRKGGLCPTRLQDSQDGVFPAWLQVVVVVLALLFAWLVATSP